MLKCPLPSGISKECKLHKVLHVPRLSYNLLCVSVATEHRKTVIFEKTGCQVLDKGKPVAVGNKIGEIYISTVVQTVLALTLQKPKIVKS